MALHKSHMFPMKRTRPLSPITDFSRSVEMFGRNGSAKSKRSTKSLPPRLSTMKMRPVLDFRMPTLANKSFLLPIEDIAAKSKSRLLQLETHPPASLRDIRSILSKEIKVVQKKITRLERSYYGVGKTLQHEVKKFAMPLKILIRMLGYFELPSAKVIDAAIKNGQDPKRYKGDPENVNLLKEAYAKVLNFIPSKFTEATELCEKILEILEKFCISFYDLSGEVEVETAVHYETQIRSWKKAIRENLEKMHALVLNFKNRGVHYTMFSSPVATFCQRNECELVPFLLMFAEVCTNVRTVCSIMNQWIKADETYSVFLQNDVRELEMQKEDHIKGVRDVCERYHSAAYKVNQAEIEYSKLLAEMENLKEKEEACEIEEQYLQGRCNEIELDLEFKEGRRDDMKHKPLDDDIESQAITWDNLNEEIRFLREGLPSIKRQLSIVQQRRVWMEEKRNHLEKHEKDIEQLTHDMKESEEEKQKREAEYETIEKTLELSRRLLLHKVSNDSVEKIFYDLPITARNNKQKLPSISNGTDGTLEQACAVVVELVDQDWMNLYCNLPFFPKRGSETIQKDISSIALEGAGGPKKDLIVKALNRWRRHHTRARAEDLKQGLKLIKRLDVMKEVELVIHPPPIEEEPPEQFPAELDPALIPFYREVLRFEELRAANRIQVVQLPDED